MLNLVERKVNLHHIDPKTKQPNKSNIALMALGLAVKKTMNTANQDTKDNWPNFSDTFCKILEDDTELLDNIASVIGESEAKALLDSLLAKTKDAIEAHDSVTARKIATHHRRRFADVMTTVYKSLVDKVRVVPYKHANKQPDDQRTLDIRIEQGGNSWRFKSINAVVSAKDAFYVNGVGNPSLNPSDGLLFDSLRYMVEAVSNTEVNNLLIKEFEADESILALSKLIADMLGSEYRYCLVGSAVVELELIQSQGDIEKISEAVLKVFPCSKEKALSIANAAYKARKDKNPEGIKDD